MKVHAIKLVKDLFHASEIRSNEESHIKLEIVNGLATITLFKEDKPHIIFEGFNFVHVSKARKKSLKVIKCSSGAYFPVSSVYVIEGKFVCAGYYNSVTDKRPLCLAPSDSVEIIESIER